MVYARKVGDRTITLQVSGLLWNRSLVMRDRETGSLWSHILGEAMRGQLEGEQLDILPAVMTTWADWKEEHPRTTVLDLSRSARGFDGKFYKQRQRFVLGLVLGGKAKAYRFDRLAEHPVIEDTFEDTELLIYFDPQSTRGVAYSRRVDERTLSFDDKLEGGKIVDTTTGSRWDPRSGRAVAGPLAGSQLEMLPAIVSFTRAWKRFHPESEYWDDAGDTKSAAR